MILDDEIGVDQEPLADEPPAMESKPEPEEPKVKKTTLFSLKKEFEDYKIYVEDILQNHAEAFDALKKALEVHSWEPDAHHPAILAQKANPRRK